jgi:ABC-type branched-subunit amino acid transport system ATPase component
MKLVMKISDRSPCAQGAFLAEGTPDEIRANPTVQQTYLGVAR